mmetsp:Transcript_7919/g.26001  ORF Transcript_7919/g.26001 Transcript_7919/m.26001 type:complete len:234 (+) Transcript_7919:489-1190(+)
MARIVSEAPAPMMFISNGEPKQAATAILASPPLAAAISETRSPAELPMAMTVRPKIEVEIPIRKPAVSMSATTSVATRLSQTMDMTKPATTRPAYQRGATSSRESRHKANGTGEQASGSTSTKGIAPAEACSASLTPPLTSMHMRIEASGGVATAHRRRRQSHSPSAGMLAQRSTERGDSSSHSALDSRLVSGSHSKPTMRLHPGSAPLNSQSPTNESHPLSPPTPSTPRALT